MAYDVDALSARPAAASFVDITRCKWGASPPFPPSQSSNELVTTGGSKASSSNAERRPSGSHPRQLRATCAEDELLPPGEVPLGLRQMSVTLLSKPNVRPTSLELLKILLKQEPNEMHKTLGFTLTH